MSRASPEVPLPMLNEGKGHIRTRNGDAVYNQAEAKALTDET